MFKNIFQNESFKPARMVMLGLESSSHETDSATEREWDRQDAERANRKPPRLEAPEAPVPKSTLEEKEEKITQRSKTERSKMDKMVNLEFQNRLSSNNGKVTTFLSNYAKKQPNWREFNEEFSKAIGMKELTGREVKNYVAAVQRIVFKALDLNERRATVDGKMGVYTIAAISAYMGWDSGVDLNSLKDARQLNAEGIFGNEKYAKKQEKIDNAYTNLLGNKLKKLPWDTLRNDLMPLIDTSKLEIRDYLLGMLYKLAIDGKLSWNECHDALSSGEFITGRSYAELFIGVERIEHAGYPRRNMDLEDNYEGLRNS